MLSSSRQLAFANHERYNFHYIVFEPGLTFRFENVQSKFQLWYVSYRWFYHSNWYVATYVVTSNLSTESSAPHHSIYCGCFGWRFTRSLFPRIILSCVGFFSDINNSPVFTNTNGVTLNVAENTALGTSLFQASATDEDNDVMTYSVTITPSVGYTLFEFTSGRLCLLCIFLCILLDIYALFV